MDIKEIRKMAEGELNKKLLENMKSLSRLTYEAKLGKLKDTSKLKKARIGIAQILTVIKEKDVLKE